MKCKELLSEHFHFNYEVLNANNQVDFIEYDDRGETRCYPQKTFSIKSLEHGKFSNPDQILVTVTHGDAEKELRDGELISLDLRFSLIKDENGNFVQHITGSNLYTLNDYYDSIQMEAFNKGKMEDKDE